jgi:hypothetical protein
LSDSLFIFKAPKGVDVFENWGKNLYVLFGDNGSERKDVDKFWPW